MEDLVLHCLKSRVENNGSLYGRFKVGPLARGQGVTVANVLRRTLLSELSGLAILCVEIPGVNHEYSNLKGVTESVLDILLNLRKIVFISHEKFNQAEIGFLKMQGPGVIKASNLKLPTCIQCVNPEQHIATLADDGVLEMKFMIVQGKNFSVQTSSKLIQKYFDSHFYIKKKLYENVSQDINSVKPSLNTAFQKKQSKKQVKDIISDRNKDREPKKPLLPIKKMNFQKFEKNVIFDKRKISKHTSRPNVKKKQNWRKKTSTNLLFLDAVFMPIEKVNFLIQPINDYSEPKKFNVITKFYKNYLKEKIIFEIWTNGSIHPKNAIHQAVEKIIHTLLPLQTNYLYKK